MMQKRRLATVVLFSIAAVAAICFVVVPHIQRKFTRQHQLNVIQEFDRWAVEYSDVDDRDSAMRAASMIDYISTYYPVTGGYQSDSETGLRLGNARQDAMDRIASGLSRYTGTVMIDPLDWPAELCDNTWTIQDGE